MQQSQSLLANPSGTPPVFQVVPRRRECGATGASQATRRAAAAILVLHIILLVVNSFSWSQLVSCLIGIVMSSAVLCMFNKKLYVIAAFVFAAGSVLDLWQVVRWVGLALMLHRNNQLRDDDDEVPTVLLGVVIVPAVLGVVSFAFGCVSAFDDAFSGLPQHLGDKGSRDALPTYVDGL
ncbi:unnamed protein product [Ectocarpus fasciculatus]